LRIIFFAFLQEQGERKTKTTKFFFLAYRISYFIFHNTSMIKAMHHSIIISVIIDNGDIPNCIHRLEDFCNSIIGVQEIEIS